MDIPENIKMRNTLHGHGAKGMAFYVYEDSDGLGVRMEARRKNGRSPFVETWFFDALPGRQFASFKALREAVLPLTPEDIEAQTSAIYPLIKEIKPDSCGNPCRLCPRPAMRIDEKTGERMFETWRVTIAYSWKDLHSLSLCDSHMEHYQSDPTGLKLAIENDARERRERAEANSIRPLPGERWEPSNCIAGEGFQAEWCCNCERDKVLNGSATHEQAHSDPSLYCPIIGASYLSKAVEWRELEDGRRICTAFIPKGQKPPPQRCANTGDMFPDSAAGGDHG